MAKAISMGWVVVTSTQNTYVKKLELKKSMSSMPKEFSIGNAEIIISQDSLNQTRSMNRNKIKAIERIFLSGK